MKPYEYKKEILTKEQKSSIKIWVQKSKEANFNINYGFSANQNIARGDYEALAISNYQGYMEHRNSDKTFDEWLASEIEYAEKRIEVLNEAREIAENLHDFDFAFDPKSIGFLDSLTLLKRVDKKISELLNAEKSGENNDAKFNAIKIAGAKAKRYINSIVGVEVENSKTDNDASAITGPIYDDDARPTYYDEKMNEI